MTTQSGFPTSVWSVEQLTALILDIINGNAIAGSFTTLTASGAVALSPANANVVLSPTGTGVVTIAPATAGSINKMNLGATTPGTAAVTTLSASGTTALSGATTVSGATVLSNASIKATALPTADPHVVGALWANSAVVTVSAG